MRTDTAGRGFTHNIEICRTCERKCIDVNLIGIVAGVALYPELCIRREGILSAAHGNIHHVESIIVEIGASCIGSDSAPGCSVKIPDPEIFAVFHTYCPEVELYIQLCVAAYIYYSGGHSRSGARIIAQLNGIGSFEGIGCAVHTRAIDAAVGPAVPAGFKITGKQRATAATAATEL